MLNFTGFRIPRNLFVALFVFAMPPALSPASQVFDASADFDPTSNPSGINGGAYSYGYTPTLGGTYSLLAGTFTNGPVVGYKHPSLPDGAPSIAKNTNNAVHNQPAGASTITYQPLQLVLHPGSGTEYAVLRFTAPQAGTYTYAAAFNGADSGTTTTDVHILVNNIGVDTAGINFGGGSSTATFSSPSIVLASGDTIDFAVGKANSTFFFDSTGLFATVALVPEPSALILLAIGGLAVAALRLRHIKSRPMAGSQ
jgi:PEP-CTERM motif